MKQKKYILFLFLFLFVKYTNGQQFYTTFHLEFSSFTSKIEQPQGISFQHLNHMNLSLGENFEIGLFKNISLSLEAIGGVTIKNRKNDNILYSGDVSNFDNEQIFYGELPLMITYCINQHKIGIGYSTLKYFNVGKYKDDMNSYLNPYFQYHYLKTQYSIKIKKNQLGLYFMKNLNKQTIKGIGVQISKSRNAIGLTYSL